MQKSWIGFTLLLVMIIVLTGCGKSLEAGDDKEEVESMIEKQRILIKASDDSAEDLEKNVSSFDEEDMTYEALKNIVKSHQTIQHHLNKQIKGQNSTPYRTKISDSFSAVIKARIDNNERILELIRLKDEIALKNSVENFKKEEIELKATHLLQVNELLDKEGVKALDALEK